MRLKLYEDAIRAQAQDEPADADAEADTPGENGGGDLTSLADAMSQQGASDTSRSSKHGKSSPSVAGLASHGTKGDVNPLDEFLRNPVGYGSS